MGHDQHHRFRTGDSLYLQGAVDDEGRAERGYFWFNAAIWAVLMGVIGGLLLLSGCEPRVPCGLGIMVNSYIHCGPERPK